MAKYSAKEMQDLIESTGGRFFVVQFVKQDGSLREIVGRRGVYHRLVGDGNEFDPERLAAQERARKQMSIWDCDTQEFRCVNLERVSYLQCGAIRYGRKDSCGELGQ